MAPESRLDAMLPGSIDHLSILQKSKWPVKVCYTSTLRKTVEALTVFVFRVDVSDSSVQLLDARTISIDCPGCAPAR